MSGAPERPSARRAERAAIAAADELRFEYAAQLRDELRELRRDLREMHAAEGPGGIGAAGPDVPDDAAEHVDAAADDGPTGTDGELAASETPSRDIA